MIIFSDWLTHDQPLQHETDLKPAAQESSEMLCIIHAHSRSICPNKHFLVSVWEAVRPVQMPGMQPNSR